MLALAGLDGLVTRSRYEEVAIYIENQRILNSWQDCGSAQHETIRGYRNKVYV